MEFNFDKVGKTISETVKKKPVIIFAIVGCLAALVYLFIRARRGDDSGAVTLAAAPAETMGSIPGSGSTGSASDAQLYNDVYGLVKQVQEQTLGQVESMISQSQRDLYNVFDAELDNAIGNTDQTLKAYQDANQASLDAIIKSINDSLGAITSKYDKLSGDQSEAAAAAQIVTVPATNDSITPAKEPSKTVQPIQPKAPAAPSTAAKTNIVTPVEAASMAVAHAVTTAAKQTPAASTTKNTSAVDAAKAAVDKAKETLQQKAKETAAAVAKVAATKPAAKVTAGSSNTSSSAVQAAIEAAKRAAGVK